MHQFDAGDRRGGGTSQEGRRAVVRQDREARGKCNRIKPQKYPLTFAFGLACQRTDVIAEPRLDGVMLGLQPEIHTSCAIFRWACGRPGRCNKGVPFGRDLGIRWQRRDVHLMLDGGERLLVERGDSRCRASTKASSSLSGKDRLT